MAHTILIIAYRIIRDGTTYEDLGSNYFDERDRRATLYRSVQRLERLGYKVTVEAAEYPGEDGFSGESKFKDRQDARCGVVH